MTGETGTAWKTTRAWNPWERPEICWWSRRMAPEARLTSRMTPRSRRPPEALWAAMEGSGAMSQRGFMKAGWDPAAVAADGAGGEFQCHGDQSSREEETRKQRALAGWSRERREGRWLPWRLRASPGRAEALMSQPVDAGLSCGPSPCPAPADVPPPSCRRESQPCRWCCPSDSPACPKRAHGRHRANRSASSESICYRLAVPAITQDSSKLVPTPSPSGQDQRVKLKAAGSSSRRCSMLLHGVASFFSFFWISLPALIDRGRQRQPQSSFFNIRRDILSCASKSL